MSKEVNRVSFGPGSKGWEWMRGVNIPCSQPLSGGYQLDLCQPLLSRRDALQLHTQSLASART